MRKQLKELIKSYQKRISNQESHLNENKKSREKCGGAGDLQGVEVRNNWISRNHARINIYQKAIRDVTLILENDKLSRLDQHGVKFFGDVEHGEMELVVSEDTLEKMEEG